MSRSKMTPERQAVKALRLESPLEQPGVDEAVRLAGARVQAGFNAAYQAREDLGVALRAWRAKAIRALRHSRNFQPFSGSTDADWVELVMETGFAPVPVVVHPPESLPKSAEEEDEADAWWDWEMRRAAHDALASEAQPVDPWLKRESSSVAEALSVFTQLREASDQVRAALKKFQELAAPERGSIPGRVPRPGVQPDLDRRTGKIIIWALRKECPPWDDDELSALFNALGLKRLADATSTRDARREVDRASLEAL